MIPLGCKPRFASAGAAVFWWNRRVPGDVAGAVRSQPLSCSPWPRSLLSLPWVCRTGGHRWLKSFQGLSCEHKSCASSRDLLGVKGIREAWKSHLLHFQLIPASAPSCTALQTAECTERIWSKGTRADCTLGLYSVISFCAWWRNSQGNESKVLVLGKKKIFAVPLVFA